MNKRILRMMRRAMGKPPVYVLRRSFQEVRREAERFFAPRRARRMDAGELLLRTRATSISELWTQLAQRPYVANLDPVPVDEYESLCPGDAARILAAAERALSHEVDLLGSGVVSLGAQIDWHKDYKSGHRWEPAFCRDIDCRNLERRSDVKFPWELSRLQWLIPCGQAYLLTGDERWAAGVRQIIEHWIDSNPYAGSVNWSCTMEAAIRVFTWTWLFHAFHASPEWQDDDFRARFLCSLYLHADFTSRHFEYSDVNGNHCDADAAGLVFAGLFFGCRGEAKQWHDRGWRILTEELPRQVSEDGVDFEGSVPYHRLVTELFFLPALYRKKCGMDVSAAYRDRVAHMAWFIEAYTRPDGSAPLWGDADDGRALPLGSQSVNDHRYLIGWIGHAFEVPSLTAIFSGSVSECVWLFGTEATRCLIGNARRSLPKSSTLFAKAGYAVLRNSEDHVFIDCADIGLAGRGGHGHNDALSCEVFLAGVPIVSDCGAFVYTADYRARNAFRSTSYHNTPRVNSEEINRFVARDELWRLHDDAKPIVVDFCVEGDRDVFVGRHFGYRRLESPLTITRTFILEHTLHALTIADDFQGNGVYSIEVPLHLSPQATPTIDNGKLCIHSSGKCFSLSWEGESEWTCLIGDAEVSPSYGVRQPTKKIVWMRTGLAVPLRIRISAATMREPIAAARSPTETCAK